MYRPFGNRPVYGDFISGIRGNLTNQKKGCFGCRVSQDIDNENIINLEETWERRLYLDKHFRSDIFGALPGTVKMLGETYEIQINGGTQKEGRDTVKSARGIC